MGSHRSWLTYPAAHACVYSWGQVYRFRCKLLQVLNVAFGDGDTDSDVLIGDILLHKGWRLLPVFGLIAVGIRTSTLLWHFQQLLRDEAAHCW